MKILDYENWPRRQAYEFFSDISDPFYMVTFRQDVTGMYEYTRKNGLSFYYGLIWACNMAINDVEAFRVAIRDDRLVILSRRDPSFTDLKKGSEQFHIVTMEHESDIGTFCHKAALLSENQDFFIDMSKENDELVYYSCLPWIDLTALTNERNTSDPKMKDDSIPHIAWGRYNDEEGKKILGMSMEVNHRFIDGIHIGSFAERMDHYINTLG